MGGVRCSAPAKVNLALHVTGQRGDGYHTLDTLAAFCALSDVVTVNATHGQSDELHLTGPLCQGLPSGTDNLALRAATALRESHPGRAFAPVAISVQKNIPAGAGLGGGSADAAAVLLALRMLWGIGDEIDLLSVAAKLGADVPMCLVSSPLRASGIGESISRVKLTRDWPAVLVFPGPGLATANVFAALASRNNSEIKAAGALSLDTLTRMRNDLETPAKTLCPDITTVMDRLNETEGARLVRMSGSGSAGYALFEDGFKAAKAAEAIRQERPHWWCMATRIMAAGQQDRAEPIGD